MSFLRFRRKFRQQIALPGGGALLVPGLLLPQVNDITPPTAPVISAAAAGPTSISISLVTPSSAGAGIARYELERSPNGTGSWSQISSNATFPYTDPGLSSTTQYFYRCRAVDNLNNQGAYSAVVNATTTASGDLVNGSAAAISGSGFGTGPTIVAWDTFEGGSNGASLTAPQVGTYSSVNQVTYSNSSPHSGTLCARSAPSASGGSSPQFKNIVMDVGVGSGGKLYFSAWLKCVGGVGGQKKIYELWGNPYVGNFAPGFGTADGYTYCAREDAEYLNDQGTPGQNYYGSEVDDSGGTWQHWEILAHLNSAGGVADGDILVRIDNTPTFNMVDRNNRRDSSRAWGPLAWVDGHTNPTGAYVVYFTDELLCQRGWARVILRQGSLRVPQLVTSWSASNIGYTVLKGALASGSVEEEVYVDSGSLLQSTTRTLQ